MLFTNIALGVLVIPHTASAVALPNLENRQRSLVNASSANGPILKPSAASGPTSDFKSFEYYLISGLRKIAPPANPAPLQFIEVIPFQGGASANVAEFVKMKINYLSGPSALGHLEIHNWNARRISELVEWSDSEIDPFYQRFDGLGAFLPGQVHMSMRQASQKLRDAQWTDAWKSIGIGKFKRTPPGHQDELFFASLSASLPAPSNWVYVGSQSGSVVQDEDPEVLSQRLSHTPASSQIAAS